MSTPTPSEVPAEAAYLAASRRLHRTLDALVMTEGQVLDLSARLDAALAQIEELRHRLEMGVGEDGASADPVGYTAAVGQAD